MNSNRIFEMGSLIISKDNDFDKIDKTLDSIKSQHEVSRKIVVLSTAKKAIKEEDKKWINERTAEFREMGTQDFKFVDIVDESANLKDSITHVFKQILFKPMAVRIHSPNGPKAGKVQLTHFAIISAGCTYETENYFSYVKEMFEFDKKAFVFYSNYDSKKMNMSDLTDEDAMVIHVHGYNFFVAYDNEESSVVDCYRKIRRERMQAKKADEAINNLDDNSYKDIIFSKSSENVCLD